MNDISDVVDVTIAIEAPATDSASFSNLLLVVQKPDKVGKEVMQGVVVVKSAKELEEFGYNAEDEAYAAVSVAFSQDPRPNKVYLIAIGTIIDDDGKGEDISSCLDRALAKNEWYGFSLAFAATITETETAAKWAESNGKLFGFTYTSGDCPINLKPYNNTFGFYAGSLPPQYKQVPDGNRYAAVAFMSKCFSYNPGSETWGLKSLKGVYASVLSSNTIENLKNSNVNFYRTIANKDITQEGKVGSGEWIDVIRFKYWLLNEIQTEVFNFMVKNEKVSFNDSGITGIQNIIESVLATAQRMGGIDEDRYDEDENLQRGYIVTAPKSSSISVTEKRNRKLTGISFIARLAGAIHEVAIRGTLVY